MDVQGHGLSETLGDLNICSESLIYGRALKLPGREHDNAGYLLMGPFLTIFSLDSTSGMINVSYEFIDSLLQTLYKVLLLFIFNSMI